MQGGKCMGPKLWPVHSCAHWALHVCLRTTPGLTILVLVCRSAAPVWVTPFIQDIRYVCTVQTGVHKAAVHKAGVFIKALACVQRDALQGTAFGTSVFARCSQLWFYAPKLQTLCQYVARSIQTTHVDWWARLARRHRTATGGRVEGRRPSFTHVRRHFRSSLSSKASKMASSRGSIMSPGRLICQRSKSACTC